MTASHLVSLLALVCMLCGCPTGVISLPSADDDASDDDNGDDDTAMPDDDTGDDDTGAAYVITDLDWRLHDDVESLVYVSWEQSAAAVVAVEYNFAAGDWQSTPSRELDPGVHEQLVVGIPFGMDANWRVVPEGGEAVDGEMISTGPMPSGLPLATVEIANEDDWLPHGTYLLTSINEDNGGWNGGTYWTFIIDRQARPVWASVAPSHHWTLFAQVAVGGDHILWDESTYWSNWDNGAASTVHRTYLDAEIEQISTPGLHHAFVQLPDDTLVWGSQYHGGGEALVEKGPLDNTETVLWDCQSDWPGSGYYCESNGLFYQEATNSFLYSFYTNNSLVEVDRSTGDSLWWAGEVNGGYDFDPSNSQFSWQHGVSYTDTGTLLLSTEANIGGHTTMVREYTVDHDADALVEVWNFNPDTYAETNGDAWRLDNDNTLHVMGAASEIYEVTMAGDVVWRLDFHGSRLLGRGEFIEDLYALVSPQ